MNHRKEPTMLLGSSPILALLIVMGLLSTCGSDTNANSLGDELESVFRIGAIPDQEPERLQRTYSLLLDYLESELPGVSVEYVPVTEYQGAVTAFKVGDLDAVWFGGLTGVQARLEVEGAEAIAQRDIDEQFRSVFIAGVESGITPIGGVRGLAALEGHSFTFGSESSTSGRLMPQSFLAEAGLTIDSSFAGEPGFSGSHDATIRVVSAGSFEVGALNAQVWDDRVAEGAVDSERVIEIFRTPPYYDYHWVAQPDLDTRFGEGFVAKFLEALISLDSGTPEQAEILDLFGAGAFIATENVNYATIEAVAREKLDSYADSDDPGQMSVLDLQSVTVRYDGGTALEQVSLYVEPGERLVLVGPSGAGKTTLLGVISGLVIPDEGVVRVLGQDRSGLKGRKLRLHRSRIGTVSQHLDMALPLRVIHNVNAGRLGRWSSLGALWSLLRPAGTAEAAATLDRVGLADRLYSRTDRLSGGERQRVAVARVLRQRPDLLLADEPTSSVDPHLADAVMDLLCGNGQAPWTTVASVHNPELARRHATRLLGLRHGRVVFDRGPTEVSDSNISDLYRPDQ